VATESAGQGDALRVEITRAIADGAKSAGRIYRIHDTKQPGLCLRVHPSGRKVWNVNWARNRSLQIGAYPHVTVAMARERARSALVERDAAGAPKAAQPPAADGTMLVRDFVDEKYAPWLRAQPKRKWVESDLAEIKALFEADFYDLRLCDVTIDLVETWSTKRLRAEVSESTVRRNLVRLKGLLSKAKTWKLLAASPMAGYSLGMDVPSGEDAYLDADEEQRLRRALAERDARMIAARASGNAWAAARGQPQLPALHVYGDHLTPLVLLALNTGLRRGELTSLHWEHADVETGVITVLAAKAKSAKARYVPMNSEVVEILRRWKDVTPYTGPRLFPITSPKTAWAALIDDAGIGKFRFHDLRHHFASRLVMGGTDLNTVRELLGHSDIKTTLRYAHLAPEHKRAAVESLLSPTARATKAPAKTDPLAAIAGVDDPAVLRALLLTLAAKLAA
jgi:integrase